MALLKSLNRPAIRGYTACISFSRLLYHSRVCCQNYILKKPLSTQLCKVSVSASSGTSILPGRASFSTSHAFGFKEDSRTTALTLVDHVKQLPSSPKIALLLGLAGLAPFIAAPSFMISSGAFLPNIALYQTFYGATILSFLGGVRWGLTLPPGSSQNPDLQNLGYSVMPQLWGWGTLVVAHYVDCHVVGHVGVMLGLAVTGYVDLSMWGYPAWFKGLRFCLTLGAVLSLWTSLMCSFLLAQKDEQLNSELQ